jgi:hypothetical protein
MLTDWPLNTTWKVTLSAAFVFRACSYSVFNNPWLSLVANIFCPLLRSVLNLLSIFAMSDG